MSFSIRESKRSPFGDAFTFDDLLKNMKGGAPMITGNLVYESCFKKQRSNFNGGKMEGSIVTFEQLVEAFPRITNKSKEKAKNILPLYASPELAALVAALMTDGHLEWSKAHGFPRAKKITLYSSNKFECEWFLSLVKKVFGVSGKLEAYIPSNGYFKKQPYKAFVSNAVVAQVLVIAGAPAGNKTEREFLVPEWIMGGTKEIKREFLRTIFTFEATTPRAKTGRQFSFEISLAMVKSKSLLRNARGFFSQIKRLLSEFELSSTRTIDYPKPSGLGKSKHSFVFSISNQVSIVNFYRHVGYFNPKKQDALKEAVKKVSKFGRVRSGKVCDLIVRMKTCFGSDEKLLNELTKFTEKKYSKRQLEHFRRGETKVPLELIFSLIKINKDKAILKELPSYANFLYEFSSSVPCCL